MYVNKTEKQPNKLNQNPLLDLPWNYRAVGKFTISTFDAYNAHKLSASRGEGYGRKNIPGRQWRRRKFRRRHCLGLLVIPIIGLPSAKSREVT